MTQKIQKGDFVTCLRPQKTYSYNQAFIPYEVGVVASVDRVPGYQTDFIVDFYSRRIPADTSRRKGDLWRCCLRRDNTVKVHSSVGIEYLKANAPTWGEHLGNLTEFYDTPLYRAVEDGSMDYHPLMCKETFAAFSVLVPFLRSEPSQEDLLHFLKEYKARFAWSEKHVQVSASQLLLTRRFDESIRIPWTYEAAQEKVEVAS